MAFNAENMSEIQKRDSGCWDSKTEVNSEDETQVTIHPNPPMIISSDLLQTSNGYLIEPYEMDVDASIKGNEKFKANDNTDCGIFMTPESGNPNEQNYTRKNSITNSIIGGNLGAIGDKGSCRSVTSIMISPSLGSAESRSSLISGGRRGLPGLNHEPWHQIFRDISLPFIIAGLGMVGAGLLLDLVLGWEVYHDIPELTVLVTPFLGLKGNLEMTLASRLSTQANIGNMNDKRQKWRICFGNLALDQLQAIVCGLVASFFALTMHLIRTGEWPLDHLLLLTSASIVTASMVSLVLGSIMVTVILLSRRYKINPDNIATPVAGSLGDVVTLYMLSFFSSQIWSMIQGGQFWIVYLIYAVYLVVVPIAFWIVYNNEFVKQVLISGWLPVIVSVVISTGGGVILDISGNAYENLALFQPLINGIGGNLVSVQASRIATQLHAECERKILPNNGRICQAPWSVFTKGVHATSSRVLLFLVIPGHIFFVTVAWLVRLYPEGKSYDFLFLFIFLVAALIQVSVLLYFAKVLSNFMWRHGQDPDVSTIPYLTATGDLLGTGVLFLAFLILSLIQ
ncbi:unnamed protein product [Orchesella dallaii]|uniref:SLC41A/MgtE integral membrane domain-containing protein n=1 Tax=Orchesella dallaii TaxID=48710 RepID=A0ABP1REV1_9HEXA